MKPRMMTVVLLALAALAPAGPDAQAADSPVSCPIITVSCPDQPAAAGPVRFTANVIARDPSVTPTFKWTVSGGKIISGQGTGEIAFEEDGRGSYTATVDVGGYPSSCRTSASCSVIRCNFVSLTRKVVEYGNVKPYEERTRLGSFAQELRNDPTAQGYVMAYAGRRAKRGEARERGARAVRYLVGGWGLDAGRLVVIDGGYRDEPAVELYLVGVGGMPPQATPTVEPASVEFVKDVRPTRARGRRTKGRNRR